MQTVINILLIAALTVLVFGAGFLVCVLSIRVAMPEVYEKLQECVYGDKEEDEV